MFFTPLYNTADYAQLYTTRGICNYMVRLENTTSRWLVPRTEPNIQIPSQNGGQHCPYVHRSKPQLRRLRYRSFAVI